MERFIRLSGKLVAKEEVIIENGRIKVPDLLNGIYVLRMITSNEVVTNKVIVE